jgi:hypothetical protein
MPPESAESYRKRHPEHAHKILSRCPVCFEILPGHWSSPHLFKGGHLVFIRALEEQERNDKAKGEKS